MKIHKNIKFDCHGMKNFCWPVFLVVFLMITAGYFDARTAAAALLVLFAGMSAIRYYLLGPWIIVLVLPIASTYFVPSNVFGLPGMNPLNAILSLSIASFFLTAVLRPRTIAIPTWPTRIYTYLAVLLLAALHGAFYVSSVPKYFVDLNVIPSNTWSFYLQTSLIKPLIMLLSVFIVSIALNNSARPTIYLIPLFISATIFPFAIFYYAINSGMTLTELGSQGSRHYLSGIGLHANELGLLLNMAFALSYFSFLQVTRVTLKIALGAIILLLIAGILLTFSRGAYLGLLAVVGYSLFVHRKLIILFLTLLLPISVYFAPSSVVDRVSHGFESNDADSVSSGRIDEIWKPLLPELIVSPLIGNGLGSILWSDAAKKQDILPVGHPHSAYLGALLDFGIIGTLIVLFFYWHMWRLFTWLGKNTLNPLWRGFFTGGAACVLLLLVQGLTDDSFMPTRTQPFLWLAYGIAIGVYSRERP